VLRRASTLANNGEIDAAVPLYDKAVKMLDVLLSSSSLEVSTQFGLSSSQVQGIRDEANYWIFQKDKRQNLHVK
jgi:hypothetical protein